MSVVEKISLYNPLSIEPTSGKVSRFQASSNASLAFPPPLYLVQSGNKTARTSVGHRKSRIRVRDGVVERKIESNIRGEEGTVTWTATSVFNGGGVSVHGCTSTRYLHLDIAACKSVSKYDINVALLSILLFLEPCTNSIETRFQVDRYEIESNN